MLGLYVSVPIVCFRKGLAREFLETEKLPPPATCYGFLLSLVGEVDRNRHVACRIAPALIACERRVSTVLRTVWRLKHKDRTPGTSGNMRPDFQQLLTGVELAIWLDSSEETAQDDNLESRVMAAMSKPASISRFGGLSLGESTHLVNDVSLIDDAFRSRQEASRAQTFLLEERGRMTLPVWVDHVGSTATRYATGSLIDCPALMPPQIKDMPQIKP